MWSKAYSMTSFEKKLSRHYNKEVETSTVFSLCNPRTRQKLRRQKKKNFFEIQNKMPQPPRVLSALDVARIQLYHFKAIIIAGMSLFTDAYDLFCIAPVLKMLGEIYYHEDSIGTPILSIFYAIALLGAALGQLIVGYLGDRLGRRRVYGLCLMIMVLSSFGCGFSVCTSRRSCVMASLGFFRFLLGLGIGGDYPLSATIMSEFANKKTRGTFISAVFSMQGLGILMSSMVTMAVCSAFKTAREGSPEKTRAAESDIAWRLILMIGSIPAALTFYWRMRMPETARFHSIIYSFGFLFLVFRKLFSGVKAKERKKTDIRV